MDWNLQRERIAPYRLHSGRNSIWFHADPLNRTVYRVRNVRLVMDPTEASCNRSLIITNHKIKRTQGEVFLKGFIQGTTRRDATVSCFGQSLVCRDGVFEGSISAPYDATFGELIARFLNGDTLSVQFDLGVDDGAELLYREAPTPYLRTHLAAFDPHSVSFSGATLEIPQDALGRSIDLTIAPLRAIDVPPITPELINVTGLSTGYRLLPDGTTFDHAIRLGLAVDPSLIPAGNSMEDVRSFYFDENDRRWHALPRDTTRAEGNVIFSRTNHFTDYINAIIQVPESPETMGHSPTSIKDYKAGDASAGISPIPPPEANNTGAATTRFPLKLPQGDRECSQNWPYSTTAKVEMAGLDLGGV
ncbi:MAG: hypothetical protein IPI72_12275 [Flavobacteriales bacterium]|nr:hypothetical protein [Flavobacteriales bacterium]